MLDELIVGEHSSLRKAVHAFTDLDKIMTILDERSEIVLLYHADRNEFDGD
jgi:hypothetical protein